MAVATVTSNNARKRVVVIGGGFAGINAAMELAKLPLDITLIDRKNHHTFQPLLYQVALAVLSPAEIAQPIRSILRDYQNVEVLMDEATGFNVPEQRILLKTGSEIEYDYLVVATGSTHSYFGRDDWAPLAPGLKTIEDAIEIRRRVLLVFELAERQMQETGTHPPLKFVIIGGGPTGVELAGAISDITRLYMAKDFRHIDPAAAEVQIFEGCPSILAAYPPDLQQKALEQLNALGVQVRTNAHVTDIQPGYIMLGDERVEAAVTLWAAGVHASPLGKLLGFPTNSRGCVFVDQFLNPPKHPEIYICGDLAHVEENGRQIPGVAQPAMQMGTYAAKRIGRLTARDFGSDGTGINAPFHYFDKGDMATIGRKAAVANIKWPFHGHWSGFPAWITWLFIHIFFLIGFRSRIAVFRQWAWTYLTFSEGARLITGSQNLPGWKEKYGSPAATQKPLDLASPKT